MRFGFLASLVILVQNAAVGYLYGGIFFLGCCAYINYFLYTRLRAAGCGKFILYFLVVQIPARYLPLGVKYGWSP